MIPGIIAQTMRLVGAGPATAFFRQKVFSYSHDYTTDQKTYGINVLELANTSTSVYFVGYENDWSTARLYHLNGNRLPVPIYTAPVDNDIRWILTIPTSPDLYLIIGSQIDPDDPQEKIVYFSDENDTNPLTLDIPSDGYIYNYSRQADGSVWRHRVLIDSQSSSDFLIYVDRINVDHDQGTVSVDSFPIVLPNVLWSTPNSWGGLYANRLGISGDTLYIMFTVSNSTLHPSYLESGHLDRRFIVSLDTTVGTYTWNMEEVARDPVTGQNGALIDSVFSPSLNAFIGSVYFSSPPATYRYGKPAILDLNNTLTTISTPVEYNINEWGDDGQPLEQRQPAVFSNYTKLMYYGYMQLIGETADRMGVYVADFTTNTVEYIPLEADVTGWGDPFFPPGPVANITHPQFYIDPGFHALDLVNNEAVVAAFRSYYNHAPEYVEDSVYILDVPLS